ncbi:MAG: hypothetical protein EXR77_05285 [Myxococcales bacterium]|nr:hypothetical protein [Myxococcales bacterium]
MARLHQPTDLDWQLDIHHGVSATQALEQFCQAYALLEQQPLGKGLVVVHGYGSSGRGGQIYLALHHLLAHNRGQLSYGHPLLNGRTNPGCTRVVVRRLGPLTQPQHLLRWSDSEPPPPQLASENHG